MKVAYIAGIVFVVAVLVSAAVFYYIRPETSTEAANTTPVQGSGTGGTGGGGNSGNGGGNTGGTGGGGNSGNGGGNTGGGTDAVNPKFQLLGYAACRVQNPDGSLRHPKFLPNLPVEYSAEMCRDECLRRPDCLGYEKEGGCELYSEFPNWSQGSTTPVEGRLHGCWKRKLA